MPPQPTSFRALELPRAARPHKAPRTLPRRPFRARRRSQRPPHLPFRWRRGRRTAPRPALLPARLPERRPTAVSDLAASRTRRARPSSPGMRRPRQPGRRQRNRPKLPQPRRWRPAEGPPQAPPCARAQKGRGRGRRRWAPANMRTRMVRVRVARTEPPSRAPLKARRSSARRKSILHSPKVPMPPAPRLLRCRLQTQLRQLRRLPCRLP